VLKDTILAVLNAEARSLGAEPVTERALEDWISEDLFKGPTEKGLSGGGSEWRYSPAALRAALEVVRLKASTPNRRNTVLRIRLWLLSFDVPINRIAEDLESEFSRTLHRRFFRNPFRYDANSSADLSEREKEKERRRAGPLDPTFVDAGLELPRDDLLRFIWEAISDPVGPSRFLKTLDHLASPFLSERGKSVLETFLKSIEPYVDTAGLFGNPEEIGESGLEAFAGINEGHLMKGRRLYQFALAMADWAGRGEEFLPLDLALQFGEVFSKTARSLRESDEWCVAGLAVCTIAASRAISSSRPK
jgi:hypothetical protein